MIWLILVLLAVVMAAYLLQPFFTPRSLTGEEQLAEARAQRAAIDLDEAEGRLSADAASQARDALDRRVLAALDSGQGKGLTRDLRTAALFLVPAVLVLGAASVYVRIGSPSFEYITVAEFRAAQAAELPQSLEELVIELRSRLEADANPPADGYVLLARSYLRLGDVEAGLEAYERAIAISDEDQQIVDERDRVIERLRNRVTAPAIDPEAAARIQAMTPEEQAVMIESMVEGLAVRLENNPDDAEGWARLIQARLVLGQRDQARRDLESAQAQFSAQPETLARFEQLASELAVAE